MVCRENKGRSAVIGYQKHLLRQLGYTDYDDFELQSGIHEFGHQYEGFPAPSKKEQLAFLNGLKQQIEGDPRISSADKHRESDRQPGMVTRIDQEISRLRTGKDEYGRPLQGKHKMRGQDLAAMQRLGVLLQRNQEAKDGYFDVYARTMGVSAAEARGRWKALVRRQKSQRENTRISLTDQWRDNLAVSGFTAMHQADIGQSNVSRDALRIMEEERRAKLDSLPTRAALTSAQRVRLAEPGKGTVQCAGEGGCGQFGHERSACPNQNLVQQRNDSRTRWQEIDAKIRKEKDRADEHARNNWAFISGYSHKEMAQMREERDRHLKHDQQVTRHLTDSTRQETVRCGTCQQFGHVVEECPNTARVDELNELRDKTDQYYAQMEARADWINAAVDEVPKDDPELERWRGEYGRYEFSAQQAAGEYRDKKAEIASAAIRCIGGCGQFGHARDECPNSALLDELTSHVEELEKIQEKVRQRAVLRKQNPDTASLTAADHALYDDWHSKSIDIDKRLLAAGIDPTRVSTAIAALPHSRTAKVPVSARIQEVGYNRDTGYLEVTTRPYTRKSDGQVMPAKTYAYRMSPSQHQQMMAASSLTSYVSQTVWAKNGGNTAYQFENVAEAAEASVQRKCATCGQWASMTAAHTCPVPGSRAGQDDAARRARIKAERQAARAAGRPAQTPPAVATIPPSARLRFGSEGTLLYADPRRIDSELSAGKVAAAQVRATFLDASVTGQAVAWNDADGQPQLSTDREDGATLACNCRAFKKNRTCGHIRLVGKGMAQRYAADHPAVGSPLRSAPLPASQPAAEKVARDAPEEGYARKSYAQIRELRAAWRGSERSRARQLSEAQSSRWLYAAGAVDGQSGKPVKTPQVWAPSGVGVDPGDAAGRDAIHLDRDKDVQDGLRAGLRAQTGKHWSVTRKPDGWLHISTALQRRTGDKEITTVERRELASALKLPIDVVSSYGVAVPPGQGWRAEMLDRASGRPPRVLGERYVARADQRPEVLHKV
ncbi:hypothetical protein [Streptomyces californicus]|uniref:hypothetical protein n=1 Tax=Streptomyces californicus TaxID=67351 RepID=UPI00296F173A|nr:hypothetical protein [Streptomyces californicus]MDW4912444.1 hypothetical protein [Streptomyces californicus]